MSNIEFCYEQAFARNLGLVSESEQQRLRQTCVALPGLGGAGGAHLQALARMGFGVFNLADPDIFELVNIQRQLGASSATLGRRKVEVMREMAAGINPEAQVRTFPEGITEANIGAFLSEVDVVVDGIEFFLIKTRRMLFRACRERRIPVVTAGPIGYGAAVLVFTPQGPSFDEYFRLEEGMTHAEQIAAFALGLAPGLASDVDPARVNVEAQRGPALASACFLCAAAAATEVLKLVTGRGRSVAAPRGVYYDLFRGRSVPLRPRPSLTRSLRGRLLRHLAFRRFPALRLLHERERARRQGVPDGALEPASFEARAG